MGVRREIGHHAHPVAEIADAPDGQAVLRRRHWHVRASCSQRMPSGEISTRTTGCLPPCCLSARMKMIASRAQPAS